MIRFQCTACGRQLQVDNTQAGKTGKCPSCQAALVVPTVAAAEPQPNVGTPPPATPVASVPTAQVGKGMAVTALVLGILGGFPLFGLIAIVLGIIVLVTKRPGKGMAIAGLILGVIMPVTVIGVAVVTPALSHARQLARCQTNLEAVSKGLAMYSATYMDVYQARSLDDLVRGNTITPEILQCPSVTTHRQSDYFYLPPPPGMTSAANTLVLCDFRDNHPGGGRGVAYADFHVKVCKSDQEFQAELSRPENAQFAAALRAAEQAERP